MDKQIINSQTSDNASGRVPTMYTPCFPAVKLHHVSISCVQEWCVGAWLFYVASTHTHTHTLTPLTSFQSTRTPVTIFWMSVFTPVARAADFNCTLWVLFSHTLFSLGAMSGSIRSENGNALCRLLQFINFLPFLIPPHPAPPPSCVLPGLNARTQLDDK